MNSTLISHYLLNISTWRSDKYFKYVSKTKIKSLIFPVQTCSSLGLPQIKNFEDILHYLFLLHTYTPPNPISTNPIDSTSIKT